MIPLDVILETHPGKALKAWRDDPRWAEAGAPYPGLRAGFALWKQGQPLRDLEQEGE